MPITLSKIKYCTRSIVRFEALEQTLRLRLVSGPADKKFFLIMGSAPTPTEYLSEHSHDHSRASARFKIVVLLLVNFPYCMFLLFGDLF
jgi:hypothetical protein